MLPINDDFLLHIAEVAASLVGLLIVGVFLYIETGVLRGARLRSVELPCIRATSFIAIWTMVLTGFDVGAREPD
jgi:hypothetical protein